LKFKRALGLDACSHFSYGAAPLKPSSVSFFISFDIALQNLYGMSEVCGSGTLSYPDQFSLYHSGKTLPGGDIKLIDIDATGQGEVCMQGRNTMMGYFKNEEACKSTFTPDRYIKSGDLGTLTQDGYVRITGRKKELIITAGGENIAPVPIEDLFKAICTGCSNIIVVGEQQKFVAALITFKVDIDLKDGLPTKNLTDAAREYFKEKCGVDITTSDQACQHPKVLDHIQKCIEETNKKAISRAATIKKFLLLSTDFSQPGGELTPTTKLKRKSVELKYKREIE
jgi:long-chain-fatty-acid--CoA ligase ACSBG